MGNPLPVSVMLCIFHCIIEYITSKVHYTVLIEDKIYMRQITYLMYRLGWISEAAQFGGFLNESHNLEWRIRFICVGKK